MTATTSKIYISTTLAILVSLSAVSHAATKLTDSSKATVSYSKDGVSSSAKATIHFKTVGKHRVVWQTLFSVKDPNKFTSLALSKPLKTSGTILINQKPVPYPVKGMRYTKVPGIPASMLHPGTNSLRLVWSEKVKSVKNKNTGQMGLKPSQASAKSRKLDLYGLSADDLKFQSGPILGYAGRHFFTVSCRVNQPASVTLTVNKRKYTSKPGLMHSFKVHGLHSQTAYTYTLTATLQKKTLTTKPFTVRTMPKKAPFKIAILGDSRTHPSDWAKVAAGVVKAKTVLSLFVGDMVTNGRNDALWDREYLAPATTYFATIPYFSVIGNHEDHSLLLNKLFVTPDHGNNWTQQVGPVLLIGIDGAANWSKNGKLAKWLEKVLADSKAKYIFLGSHYPAWTSGHHGALKNGHPREKPIKDAQDVIMPLLKKYHASAMFAGHDHFYERSEPKNGVTMIVTGGAGAPLRDKVHGADKQNPYSVVFNKNLHYCILSVGEDFCTMDVITTEGEVIDTCKWAARK